MKMTVNIEVEQLLTGTTRLSSRNQQLFLQQQGKLRVMSHNGDKRIINYIGASFLQSVPLIKYLTNASFSFIGLYNSAPSRLQ